MENITLNTKRYEELVRAEVELELIKNAIKNRRYNTDLEDIERLFFIKEDEREHDVR